MAESLEFIGKIPCHHPQPPHLPYSPYLLLTYYPISCWTILT